MKLERLSVKNYRTLEDVNVVFSGYYTAISGQNNAGKTSLIRAIRTTFRDNTRDYYYRRKDGITYRDDKTQWVKGKPNIVFDYQVRVSGNDDPGLFQFLER